MDRDVTTCDSGGLSPNEFIREDSAPWPRPDRKPASVGWGVLFAAACAALVGIVLFSTL